MIYRFSTTVIKLLIMFFIMNTDQITLKFTWRVNFHFSGVCAGVPGSIDPDHGNDPGLLAPP